MTQIFREISKTIILAILWGIPVLLSWLFKTPHFLWFFAISLLETTGVLAHYEDLARIEAQIPLTELEENEYE